MKATGLLSCMMILTALFACRKENATPSTVFPNSDFESWEYNALQNWTANGCAYCYTPINTYVVQKNSLTVYHGKYAAKFIYNGISKAVAENRFPLGVHPSALAGYIKTSIYGADTVSIKLSLYKNSRVVDSGQWQGFASTNRYVRIFFSVTHSAALIDSAKVTITGGHYKTGDPAKSTVFWVDDLSLE